MKSYQIQRSNHLNYLGKIFDLSVKGEVAITMPLHVNKVIEEFPGKLTNGAVSSPNTDKFFEIRKDAKDLDPENAKVFHRLVA